MIWAKILAGLVSLLNRFFRDQHDQSMRREGAKAADLAEHEIMDAIRNEAENIRRRSSDRSKSDLLKWM